VTSQDELYQRYEEEVWEESEQQQLEAMQEKRAITKFGAKDRKERGGEFDFVIEDKAKIALP